MKNWLTLILTLPTENATARMRTWRTLKASGAAVLRDGVYLLPDLDDCRATLHAVTADVTAHAGTAYLLHAEEPAGVSFKNLFDRRDDYAALLLDVQNAHAALDAAHALDETKRIRKLRKNFAAIEDIDFFPGEARNQADAALRELELAINRLLAPDEPHAVTGDIRPLTIKSHQGKTWATRRRPWVDRLASAWLIRRFIDNKATILWLEDPADCPPDALGFDFDGATFTHVGGRVTFEVLLASFGLDQPALRRIGSLVHYLDAGGVQPPESIGVESVLAGLRQAITDDDQLLTAASSVFDALLTSFEKTPPP